MKFTQIKKKYCITNNRQPINCKSSIFSDLGIFYLSCGFGRSGQVSHFSFASRQVEQQVDSQLLKQLFLLLRQLSSQLLLRWRRQSLDSVLVTMGSILEPISSVQRVAIFKKLVQQDQPIRTWKRKRNTLFKL